MYHSKGPILNKSFIGTNIYAPFKKGEILLCNVGVLNLVQLITREHSVPETSDLVHTRTCIYCIRRNICCVLISAI